MNLTNGMKVISIPDMSGLTEVQKGWWRKWIEALEGDKYIQGRCQLKFEERFCCLGVVQDIIKDKIGGRWVNGTFMDGTPWHQSPRSLIRPSMLFLGVEKEYGIYVDVVPYGQSIYTPQEVQTYGLDQLNDGGVSFKEIAAILRKALEGGLKN